MLTTRTLPHAAARCASCRPQLRPGALMHELQPQLDKCLGPLPAHMSLAERLLAHLCAQLQEQAAVQGSIRLVRPAAELGGDGAVETGMLPGLLTTSNSADSSSSSSLTEPALHDTGVSQLVFTLCFPAGAAAPQQTEYQLLVPDGAVAFARQAAAGAAAAAEPKLQSEAVQPQGGQRMQEQQGARGGGRSVAWQPDSTTQSLLELLPNRWAMMLSCCCLHACMLACSMH